MAAVSVATNGIRRQMMGTQREPIMPESGRSEAAPNQFDAQATAEPYGLPAWRAPVPGGRIQGEGRSAVTAG